MVGVAEYEEPKSRDQIFRLSSFLEVAIAFVSFVRIACCHLGYPEISACCRLEDLADHLYLGPETQRRDSSRMILAPNAVSPSSYQIHWMHLHAACRAFLRIALGAAHQLLSRKTQSPSSPAPVRLPALVLFVLKRLAGYQRIVHPTAGQTRTKHLLLFFSFKLPIRSSGGISSKSSSIDGFVRATMVVEKGRCLARRPAVRDAAFFKFGPNILRLARMF